MRSKSYLFWSIVLAMAGVFLLISGLAERSSSVRMLLVAAMISPLVLSLLARWHSDQTGERVPGALSRPDRAYVQHEAIGSELAAAERSARQL